MNIWEGFGIVGGFASIAGLIYAVYFSRKNRRVKLLAYDATHPISLANAVSPEDDYSLAILFQREGVPEERIESVHVQFLRVVNLGREPIRREDIAPANPIRIHVKGERVLDIAKSGETRDVNMIDVTSVKLGTEESYADLLFDFLDFQDGVLVKILTTGSHAIVKIHGDIIGMPEGIKSIQEISSLNWWGKIGFTLAVAFEISSIVLTFFVFRWVTGSWSHLWLLFLPFLALIIPMIIIAIIGATIWPESKTSIPNTLTPPSWFHQLVMKHRIYADPHVHEMFIYQDEQARDRNPHDRKKAVSEESKTDDVN